MDNSELKAYIAQSRAKGVSDAEIRSQLLATGWPTESIDEGLGNVAMVSATPAYVPQATSSGLGTWVAFEYVIMFISLAFAATGVAGLLHHWVDANISVQPSTASYYSLSYYSDYLVPFYISTCIVAFPIFAFLALKIRLLMEKQPSVRRTRVRRAAIYIALIWTFLAMLIRLIETVYDFVKGDAMVANILSHLVITLLISGLIFFYFAMDVRKDIVE